ncbi:aminotransferase class I/II-fold pyridoxal phosphate-dependent enzyme [Flavobacterium lindanitolerans]|uniref:aminotransferase class I/II-fold pyridoxal phosphate-dependent enzyme n=1 Tax=Flavobacterium lindanitolerans TaxID=428988 RepID=UPI0027BA4E08|nr:pyridoxal phosphate-dependent aminotransferase family protein [Flavobacterium lindanitolerans]
MKRFPKSLQQKIEQRKQGNSFRVLPEPNNLIDFASNDYLGFSKSEAIFQQTHQYLLHQGIIQNGATGSRLLSGNHALYKELEEHIARFHDTEMALVFNSGYDANLGFFSSVPQRNDFILYDEYSHASIRDGIRLSNARSFKFEHNNLDELEALVLKYKSENSDIYIVTESVFSMDGDSPDLERLAIISEQHGCFLVIDEAHALGVFGESGQGLVQDLGVQDKIFARIVTFGKGLGTHGAAILGSKQLKDFLVNFARSFIYTTAIPPHSVAGILIAYKNLEIQKPAIEKLRNNILHFNQEKQRLGLKPVFVRNKSAIQSAIIPGNDKVKAIAGKLQQNGFDVKAILSPTVPENQERLRFCLHSFNSGEEITKVLETLANYLF